MRSAAVPAAAAAATTTGSWFAWLCFVDAEGATTKITLVERFDGLLGRIIIRHLNKSKASGATSFAIIHKVDSRHFTEPGKEVSNFVFCCAEREISYVDTLHLLCLLA